MSDHEKIYELISLKLDGLLDASGERALEEHLASCGACREVYELLRDAREALSPGVEPPEALLPNVMEGVERINKARRSAKKRRVGVAAGVFAAAAAVALAILPLASGDPDASPNNGITLYELDDPAERLRDAAAGDETQDQMISLNPGAYSIPAGLGVQDEVMSLLEDYYAVAYFEEIPEELTQGISHTFADGSVGYDTTWELLGRYVDLAVKVDYPNPDGEKVMAMAAQDLSH